MRLKGIGYLSDSVGIPIISSLSGSLEIGKFLLFIVTSLHDQPNLDSPFFISLVL